MGLEFPFFDLETESPIDLSGGTASFGMRLVNSDMIADLTATSENNEVLIDVNAVRVVVKAERLDELPPGRYDFEVKTTNPEGFRQVKLTGKIDLKIGIAP